MEVCLGAWKGKIKVNVYHSKKIIYWESSKASTREVNFSVKLISDIFPSVDEFSDPPSYNAMQELRVWQSHRGFYFPARNFTIIAIFNVKQQIHGQQ